MDSALLVMGVMDFVPILIGLIGAAVRSGCEREPEKAGVKETRV